MQYNVISYSAAISACEKGGQWQHALALLQTMCNGRVWPDTVSYGAAISACEKGKRWELALELLKECKTWATPNTVSYNAATIACEKGGQWQHALILMKAILLDRVCASGIGLLGEGELHEIVAGTHGNFVLVTNLLQTIGTWDDHSDREFNKSLYSTALRCL